MAKKIQTYPIKYLSSLSEAEKAEINESVNYKLELSNYNTLKKMALAGGFINALAGFFVIWILHNQINHSVLFGWYSVLLIFNFTNVAWSVYFGKKYAHMTVGLLKKWHHGLYYLLSGLSLTWGSIGILFISHNPVYQLFVITFLQIVVLSYGFGSIFDFLLVLICIVCLLIPTISYQVYDSIQQFFTLGNDNFLNLAFSISLFILGGFLLFVCYVGYKLTVTQATLSFLNEALNEKLNSMNQFLEQRVRERTADLEKSLKLVTYQATHDLLTDLPNQRLLLEYLQKSIDSSNSNNHYFAVVFYSINEMEKINDGLGYQAGDLVIKTIAQRFKNTIDNQHDLKLKSTRYIVTLSRKDSFVIILDPVSSLDDVESKAEYLFSILEEPIVTESQTVNLTASIGMSIYPAHGADIQTLLMNADAAMLKAKQRGGNSLHMYQSDINADISRQLKLESSLHDAIKNNEFILQYQPFIDLKTGQICGMEALIRWIHPTLGYISPIHFIALAEKNGVIVPMGEWVLRTACTQLKAWHDLGYHDLKISVNLSSKQLLQKNIIQVIHHVIKESRINPEYLELELTESEAFQDDVLPILRQLKAMKLGLSIDDFGTGYSGLTNLKLISIDKLKIDKSFVQDVTTNNHSKAIVSNIINLSKKLHVMVLAEGVETKEQLDFLKEHECNLIQGYYFSRPLSAEEFTKLLGKNMNYNI